MNIHQTDSGMSKIAANNRPVCITTGAIVWAQAVLRYLSMRSSQIHNSSEIRKVHNTPDHPFSWLVIDAINSKLPSCILMYEPVFPCSFW